MEAVQWWEVIKFGSRHVAQAREKVVDAIKVMLQDLQEEDGGFLINAMYYLQAASALLEDEHADEEFEAILMFLALTWRHMQGTRGTRSSKLRNALRDAMIFIGVGISGHHREQLMTVLSSSGLHMDANMTSQMWKAYHDIFRETTGSLNAKNRPRKGKKKRDELRDLDPADSPRQASTPSPSLPEVVILDEMD